MNEPIPINHDVDHIMGVQRITGVGRSHDLPGTAFNITFSQYYISRAVIKSYNLELLIRYNGIAPENGCIHHSPGPAGANRYQTRTKRVMNSARAAQYEQDEN